MFDIGQTILTIGYLVVFSVYFNNIVLYRPSLMKRMLEQWDHSCLLGMLCQMLLDQY